jgi:hypothetical protein
LKGGNPSDPGIWWAQRLLAGGAVSLELLLWFRAHRREAIPRMAEVTELISQLLTQHDRNRPCMERCLRNKVDIKSLFSLSSTQLRFIPLAPSITFSFLF